VEGGRPAVARKITANLDSDDEILVSMKLQGRPDKEISDTLIKMGRVKYNMKTIGSRWKRLRIALAKALDEELDKKTAKWSTEEVCSVELSGDEHLLILERIHSCYKLSILPIRQWYA
jgi:hypothetical protein